MKAGRKSQRIPRKTGRPIGLKEGGCYFLIGYYDEDLKVPSIETYIYLGRNLRGEHAADERWYFQEAGSFIEGGRPASLKNRKNDDILCSPADHLRDFLDGTHLARLLARL